MRSRILKRQTLLTALMLIAAAFLGLTVYAGTFSADAADNLTDFLNVVQISDVHYFPYSESYNGDISDEDYQNTDFYADSCTDTKLILESGTILSSVISEIIAAANDPDPNKRPDVLILTGDLTKNSELRALIDVANALRYLQNTVRNIYDEQQKNAPRDPKPFFQILAVPGNHDVNNSEAMTYDPETGERYAADSCDIPTFAKVFAGLGYKNLTGADLDYAKKYWRSDYVTENYAPKYLESRNAENIKFTYFTDYINDPSNAAIKATHVKRLNELSYIAEIHTSETKATDRYYSIIMADGTDRITAEAMIPVKLMLEELPQDDEDARNKIIEYNDDHGTNYHINDVYICTAPGEYKKFKDATAAERSAAVQQGEPSVTAGYYIDYPYEHITGGRFGKNFTDWLRRVLKEDATTAPYFANDTIILGTHFNLLNQWLMESEILKDFTLYNWEAAAKDLISFGLRYVFTGHMHASDIQSYIDASGNVYWSFETGSTVSLGSPIRFVQIQRYGLSPLKENVITWITNNNDISTVQGLAINEPADIAVYPELFVCKDFIGIDDISTYMQEQIYDRIVDRLIDAFVNEARIEWAKQLVTDMIYGLQTVQVGNFSLDLSAVTTPLTKIATELINTIAYELDFYGEDGSALTLIDMLVTEIKTRVVYEENGKKWTFIQTAIDIYKRHITGTEFRSVNGAENDAARAAEKRAVSAMIAAFDNGSLIKFVFDTLLNPLFYNDGSLLKEVLNKKFDFTAVLTANEISTLTSVLQMAVTALSKGSGYKVNLAEFSVSEVFGAMKSFISPIIGGATGFQLPEGDLPLTDLIAVLLHNYLTDSFFEGLGGIAGDIIFAFAFDATEDGSSSTPYTLKYNPADTFTYDGQKHPERFTPDFIRFGAARDVLYPSANGQLPSLLTAAHGGDNQTAYAIKFYTAEDVSGILQYRKAGTSAWILGEYGQNVAESKTVSAAYPLIDLGLFATYTATEYISLVNGNEVALPIAVYDSNGNLDLAKTLLNAEKADKNSALRLNRHTYLIKNLEAGVKYEFRVAGKDIKSSKVFWLPGQENENGGNYYSFKTAPAENTPFNVLAIADMQGMLNKSYLEAKTVFDAIGASAYENLKYDFILDAGDNVDNGKNFKQWSYFLNNFGGYTASTAIYTAAGNHESSGYAIDNIFPYSNSGLLPDAATENGVYYSFRYSNAYFIVLNTNDADADGLGGAQTAWLKTALADADALKASGQIQWTVVMMHKSLYSAGSHSFDGEVVAMRHSLTSLFYDHNVDIVLGGHDHTWSATAFIDRFGNVVSNRPADSNGWLLNPHGVLYVTLGTIGGKFYEYQENPEVTPLFDMSKTLSATLDRPTFGSLSFDGNSMVFFGYQLAADGVLKPLKSTQIIKSADALTSSVDLEAFEYGGQRFEAKNGATVRVDKNVNPRDFRPIFAQGNYAYKWTLAMETSTSGVYKEITDKSASFKLGNNTVRFTYSSEDGSKTAAVTFTVYRMNDKIFAGYLSSEADFISSLFIDEIYAGDGGIIIDYFAAKKNLSLTYDEEHLAKDAIGQSYNRVELITDGVNAGRYGKLTVRIYAEDGTYYDFAIATERENYVRNTALFSSAGGVLFLLIAAAILLILLKKRKLRIANSPDNDGAADMNNSADTDVIASVEDTNSPVDSADNADTGGVADTDGVSATDETNGVANADTDGMANAENTASDDKKPDTDNSDNA
ncbi:MAG: metallophosphoesterase [Clostridiaceae bacterium]|jgi:3',5'-cyclic AMP phosphodiesterase CpdA|nr:metallophosphoesterase [Clostridiaceae bacterium]